MSASAVYSKAPKIVCRRIDDEYVLVPIRKVVRDDDCLYTLNEVGSLIWENLDGKKALSRIAREISDKTGHPLAEVEKDAREFMADLEAEKLAVRK